MHVAQGRGCPGPPRNVSHRLSRVFLAGFPEETRPTAAACPPLPSTQPGPKGERGWGSRAGDPRVGSPLRKVGAWPRPVPPQWPPAHPTLLTGHPRSCVVSCQTWEAFGKREGEALQGGAQFHSTRTVFALKPSYPNHRGLHCQCSTRCALPAARAFLQLLPLPHPPCPHSLQTSVRALGDETPARRQHLSGWCYRDLQKRVAAGSRPGAPGPGLSRLLYMTHISCTAATVPLGHRSWRR